MFKTRNKFDFGIDFDCELWFMKDTDIDAFILGQKAQATKYKDTLTRFFFQLKKQEI